MITIFVSFTIQAESEDLVKPIIQKFINSIKQNEPETVTYRSFQQTNEPSKFVHVMTFTNEQAHQIHRNSAYCKEFVEVLYPLCSEEPKAINFSEIKN